MRKFTLDYISSLLVSPQSYVRHSEKSNPSSSSMTIFGTFVQSTIPLEEEKEDQAIKDWIYREEEYV